MYTTSYFCASNLNQFMMYWKIQELELDDGPACFHIDDIEEHSYNCSPSQYQTMNPVFMPSYFSLMLYMNHTDMWKISRPMTYELISLDDKIIYSTRRTQHTHSGTWSPLRTGFIPINNNHHQQSNSCSPSLSFFLLLCH